MLLETIMVDASPTVALGIDGGHLPLAAAAARIGEALRDVPLIQHLGHWRELVANLLVAVHTAAAAEAMLLVERAGLDVDVAIRVLGAGAGSSMMLTARANRMIARQFADPAPGPVGMLTAYFGSIRELAAPAGAPLPLFSTASNFFERALASGRMHQDISCVIEVLAGTSATKGT